MYPLPLCLFDPHIDDFSLYSQLPPYRLPERIIDVSFSTPPKAAMFYYLPLSQTFLQTRVGGRSDLRLSPPTTFLYP